MSSRISSSTTRRVFFTAIGLTVVPFTLRASDAPPVADAPPVDAPAILHSGPESVTPQAEASSTDAAAPESIGPKLKVHPAGPLRYDRAIRDSMGTVGVRTPPENPADLPPFFAEVQLMHQNKDDIGEADYLRHVVFSANVLPQHRARAMLMLADCMQSAHQEAAALCWLKIWMQLYPGRPEAAGVSFRIAELYKSMGLPDAARDAYYLSLAHSVNEGQVNNADDLKQYTRLTNGTLWAMAANEYQNGQWDRAAQLLARFQKEAPTAAPILLENAAFLQADCYYQLKEGDKAIAQYEATLKQHPFNPLVPQARLRLYHLDVMKKEPQKAAAELASMIWTVRTVWPQQEEYWKKQTAQLLLAINQKDTNVLPPLVKGSVLLQKEGKPWQDSLNHYDTLVSYQAAKNKIMDLSAQVAPPETTAASAPKNIEEAELAAADRKLNQLLPLDDSNP